MTAKLEEAAKAAGLVADEHRGVSAHFTWNDLSGRILLLEAAREALLSIREPDEAMLSAGWFASTTLFDPGVKDIWQAMIDAIIGEKS